MATTPRRPLVPGPSDPQPTQQSISQRAIALREQAKVTPPPTNGGLAGTVAPTHVVTLHPTPVGHIAGAIAAVMSQVGTIEKGGKNEYFGYRYARMEDLLHVITPLMGKHGLAIMQNEVAKEILEGNRLAVTYEFSIFHSSNEIWPEKPRFTGMCISRDRKGNWDDKAIAKCHTNARKYFLLALFQVPAGDFDDNDGGDANQRQEHRPVPGPSATTSAQASRVEREAELKRVDESTPHRIVLGQGSGPDQWGSAFIRAINAAKTVDEVKAWDAANEAILQALSEKYPGVYDQIDAAVQRRINDLSPAMPVDSNDAMNWVAEQLQQLKTLEAAEAFWKQYVIPRREEFDSSDWSMLTEEWNRTVERLTGDGDPDVSGETES
jgi:hypothetical protein